MSWSNMNASAAACGVAIARHRAIATPQAAIRLRWEETLARRGQVAHLLRRLKAFAERFVLCEPLHDLAQTLRVGPAQQTAVLRWKADAEDQSHIDIGGITHDA